MISLIELSQTINQNNFTEEEKQSIVASYLQYHNLRTELEYFFLTLIIWRFLLWLELMNTGVQKKIIKKLN